MQTLEFINNSFLFKLLILTLNKRLKNNINQTSVELKNKIFFFKFFNSQTIPEKEHSTADFCRMINY
ncbi:hypothetical protein [Klebsiella pneumoniae IS39]|nr:hypothetical protein [Klebsiella pneumoniae IS39]